MAIEEADMGMVGGGTDWSNFYMKVLTMLVSVDELSLRVRLEAKPKDGVTAQQLEETKTALRRQGLGDDVKAE